MVLHKDRKRVLPKYTNREKQHNCSKEIDKKGEPIRLIKCFKCLP